jgi:hypothetical protein
MGIRALPIYGAPLNKLFHVFQQRVENSFFAKLYRNNTLYDTLILSQAFQ